MAVSFLGLSAIPARKITDRGLGLDRFELVPIEVVRTLYDTPNGGRGRPSQ
jgi:hypothetical protein